MMAGAPPHPVCPSTLSNLNDVHMQPHNPHFSLPQQPSYWRPVNANEYDDRNQPPQGVFPSTLVGPGLNPDLLPHPQPERPPNTDVASANHASAASADNTGMPPTKRRKLNVLSGPLPGDTSMEASSQNPSPPLFTPSAHRSAASDVWVFTRPLTSAEEPPSDQWQTSPEPHDANKPQAAWFGCILCTKFGCAIRLSACRDFRLTLSYRRDDESRLKRWRVFQNKDESSPTTTFRRHLKDYHPLMWEQECARLGIPFKNQTKKIPQKPTIEPFTKEGLRKRLNKFISSSGRVRPI